MFLSRFTFPDDERETDFFRSIRRKCYNDFYPFKILSARDLLKLEFEPITILYGGNGSGKSTALNIIAEKLNLQRDTLYNRSSFFEDYTEMCGCETRLPIPPESRVITSDDVFDYMLNLRALNQGIDETRVKVFEDYMNMKFSKFQLKSLRDYDALVESNKAKRQTQSRFTREHLMANAPEKSNGESAAYYFQSRTEQTGLYLLDEPENSLSPLRQQELTQYVEEQTRFYNCQFIIATHSPFVLAMRGAKVYDLDADPACARPWTQLPAVRAYYDFFQKHKTELETAFGGD